MLEAASVYGSVSKPSSVEFSDSVSTGRLQVKAWCSPVVSSQRDPPCDKAEQNSQSNQVGVSKNWGPFCGCPHNKSLTFGVYIRAPGF